MLVIDAEARVLHVQGDAFSRHGLSVDGWAGRALDELLPTEVAGVLLPRYRDALRGIAQAFDHHTLDGTRTYRIQIAPIPDSEGRIGTAVAVMQDVTEHLRVSSELALSESRLREAERLAGVGSWEVRYPSREVSHSPGVALLLGVPEDETLDLYSYFDHIHPDDREHVWQAGTDCKAHGSSTCEYRIIRPDGTIRTLSSRNEMVADLDGSLPKMRGALIDLTDQRAAEREQLAAMELFRQGFDAAPIGMALSDPESGRCTRVNDAMCELLQRPRSELLGESMYAFTHPDDRDEVWAARARMLDGAEPTFKSEHRIIRRDGSVAWGLLHTTPIWRADGIVEALHSQMVDITARKEREAQLEHDVSDAIWLGRIRSALDQQRMVLYAQPIIDLTTGEAVQHELLLRMRDEDGEIIAPSDFLPIAERYGLISEIDRWVIRQAAQIAATGGPAEFNLSARSVGDPEIIRELAAAIEDTGADPSLLVVEVTETALLHRTDVGRQFAEQVRGLGCRLALDDFGTGFSSLSYLKHLPADYLKIDIEFVRELTTNETDMRVVRGIVGLAREFHQITIAEGVEDERTLMLLKELGVDQAQGYLFGRPAPRPGSTDAPNTDGHPHEAGCEDPIGTVQDAFAAFADRDLEGMLRHCRPDIVLRPSITSQLAERRGPYRGHDGIRAYLRDVMAVWDELTIEPITFRRAGESVIGFGQTAGRHGDDTLAISMLWVIRLQDGQIAALQVFQTPAWSPPPGVSAPAP